MTGSMGLLVLGGIQLFVVWTYVHAFRAKRRVTWGATATLLFLLAATWDIVPTWIAFEYYARKEAGFTVFKSLEQWKKENAGVAETLEPYGDYDKRSAFKSLGGRKSLYPLNARFAYTAQHSDKLFLSVYAQRYTVLDVTKNEVLMSYVEVGSGNGGGLATGGEGWWAFWLVRKPDQKHYNRWSEYRESARGIGAKK